jgi:uncharacterized RDD family membrane protein YckC
MDPGGRRYQNPARRDQQAARHVAVTAEELTVRGSNGIDTTPRIAGPGTRSYAFLIDWHIRVLIAAVWVLAGVLIARMRGGVGSPISALFPLPVVLPAVLIYFLYHPALELLMRGRTPGKRLAGVRIVTREGATPGAGPLLMRNLLRLVDALPVLYAVGLACCLASARRVRMGDIAAGTVLVRDDGAAPQSSGRACAPRRHSRIDPGAARLAQDLLDRWPELEAERRSGLACALLAKLDGQPNAAQLAALDQETLRSRLHAIIAAG